MSLSSCLQKHNPSVNIITWPSPVKSWVFWFISYLSTLTKSVSFCHFFILFGFFFLNLYKFYVLSMKNVSSECSLVYSNIKREMGETSVGLNSSSLSALSDFGFWSLPIDSLPP